VVAATDTAQATSNVTGRRGTSMSGGGGTRLIAKDCYRASRSAASS
jgi:hypothetical protein